MRCGDRDSAVSLLATMVPEYRAMTPHSHAANSRAERPILQSVGG